MVSNDKEVKIGKPFVDGAKVVGKIISQKKGPKTYRLPHDTTQGFHKKTGHRQNLTSMKITKISM